MTRKGTSVKQEIIAKIESEMNLRELIGGGNEQFIPGLKAAIAVIDPEYFKEKYIQGKQPKAQ